MKKNKNKLNIRKNINDHVLEKTYEYQKKYGFKMGTGEHATWNNEADAFKHAYMSACLSLSSTESISRFIGNYHELETPKSPRGETNMDLWNNSIGREIAYEIKQELGDFVKNYKDDKSFLYDIAAEKVVERLKKGDLIINPNDKRSFKNMQKDRLNLEDRIFYADELNNYAGPDKDVLLNHHMNQAIENNWKMPSKTELNVKVLNGDLIYVKDYVRGDGVRVNGYYRRKLTR